MKRFSSIKLRFLHCLLFPSHRQPAELASSYCKRRNWREVAVAMLLYMLRRVKRDAGLASGFTRMCRPRCHLPSWCLRSLIKDLSSLHWYHSSRVRETILFAFPWFVQKIETFFKDFSSTKFSFQGAFVECRATCLTQRIILYEPN